MLYSTNLTLLHALGYKWYDEARNCTSGGSLLPSLTRNGTAVTEPVNTSRVQPFSRSTWSPLLLIFFLVIYLLHYCFPFIWFPLGLHQTTPKTTSQALLQYKNVFNDHAKRNFCYWLIEKKSTTCKCLFCFVTFEEQGRPSNCIICPLPFMFVWW